VAIDMNKVAHLATDFRVLGRVHVKCRRFTGVLHIAAFWVYCFLSSDHNLGDIKAAGAKRGL